MRKLGLVVCGLLFASCTLWAQPKVIAHRGYWNVRNSAQNSIAALYEAYAAGVYGSEFDVHATKDNVVVVNHDDDIHGVMIEDAMYDAIKSMELANGETLPTLRQYLEVGKKLEGLQLILEIKAHATSEREDRCVAATVKEVKALGLESRVDYISFSMHACEQVLKEDASARVYYLGGDVAPEAIKEKGFAGIDYDGEVLLKNPQWIAKSHALGMQVNVWTIDELPQIQQCVAAGVDYITTNKPVEAKRIAEGKRSF